MSRMPRRLRPNHVPISIYLPEELHRAVKARAALDGTTLEALIVVTLTGLIESDPRLETALKGQRKKKK